MNNEAKNGIIKFDKSHAINGICVNANFKLNKEANKDNIKSKDVIYMDNSFDKSDDQKNNNKSDAKKTLCKSSDPVVEVYENSKPVSVPKCQKESHKKTNFITKLIRRLSKPGIFSKESKLKKTKEKTERPSLQSDNKCNMIDNNENNLPPRSKSFKHMFHKLGKSKTKISSAVNASENVLEAESCNDVSVEKVSKEELEICNSSSVDCILDHQVCTLSKQEESASINSEDLKDHEQKINAPNNKISCTLREEISDIDTSRCREAVTKNDEDILSPLNVNMTLRSLSADMDGTCRPALPLGNYDNSSNVRLTLSLYGYGVGGLSKSRFNSKSCIEFRSAPISACNTQKLSQEINYFMWNGTSTKVQIEEKEKVEMVCDKKDEELMGGTDIELRRSGRPSDIQIRRSRVTSQSSMARSSLIMVAMSHNTPRNKSLGSHVTTPTYSLESPTSFTKKLDFEEEVTVIEEEKIAAEKDGHYFLLIANRYEEEINAKIEIVQRYLESYELEMNEEVIGELRTAVGLAKLLVSEKFVQFRGLCDQNLNEPSENEFKTLQCDLEGYLTTLEIQKADLDRNFHLVERIRENNWQMPAVCPASVPTVAKNRKSKSKVASVDTKRSVDAKKRIAEFRKMSAASHLAGTSSIFTVQ